MIRETSLFTGLALVAALSAGMSPNQARAAVITGDTLDAYLEEQEAAGDEDAVGPAIVLGQSANTLKVGVTGFPGGDNKTRWGQSAIFVFQLPDAPAGGVTDAAFAFTVTGRTSGGSRTNRDADLYGLPFNSTGVIDPAYHFDGPFGTDTTTGVMAIQQSILLNENDNGASSTQVGARVETSLAGDTALAAYLQAQYDAGAVAGDYVFLRINWNTNYTKESSDNVARSWSLASAENTEFAPTLTIIPEPASLALLGLGGVVMFGRRRSA